MINKETGYYDKPYEDLGFSDDFMFGKVTQDKELSRYLLECLLQREVGELQDAISQKEVRYTKKGKPIRMDMYTRDDKRVYDSEMMNQNKKSIESLQLSRRTRFYQSSIDTDHMNRNASYKSLPDSAILFICTFDPFGRALSKYTFQPKCLEDDELYLNDGTEWVFYNCTYEGDDIPEDLRQFYEYMQSGKADNDLTRRIDNAIAEAKKREEWKSEYMKERVLLMDAREEGREEEKINTERERERADKADERAAKAEAQLARYIMTFGELKDQ